MAGRHRVVIVGGGFGGLRAARALKSAPVDVTLIAAPIRAVLGRHSSTTP